MNCFRPITCELHTSTSIWSITTVSSDDLHPVLQEVDRSSNIRAATWLWSMTINMLLQHKWRPSPWSWKDGRLTGKQEVDRARLSGLGDLQSCIHDILNDLQHDAQIWDRLVGVWVIWDRLVGVWVIWVQWQLLQKCSNNSLLAIRRQCRLLKQCVVHLGDVRSQDITGTFNQPRWSWIELTLLVVRLIQDGPTDSTSGVKRSSITFKVAAAVDAQIRSILS